MIIISASIDLSKIDKSKIIEGKKGKYYNFDVIVKDEKDQYGKDVQVVEPQTKEQRQAKTPRVFLGQGKKVWESNSQTTTVSTTTETSSSTSAPDYDLPF